MQILTPKEYGEIYLNLKSESASKKAIHHYKLDILPSNVKVFKKSKYYVFCVE
jgi:hypothetical protein